MSVFRVNVPRLPNYGVCHAIIPSSIIRYRKYLKPKLKTVSTKLSEFPTQPHTMHNHILHILRRARYPGPRPLPRASPATTAPPLQAPPGFEPRSDTDLFHLGLACHRASPTNI